MLVYGCDMVSYAMQVTKKIQTERRKTMNKTELVRAIAAKSEATLKDAELALNAVLDTIVEELKNGEKIVLPGFGSFEVKCKAARTGINPKTKEKITIAASKAPTFKAGKGLKDAVN